MTEKKKVVSDDTPLARCMGGKFCNHAHGTCTATAIHEMHFGHRPE